MTAWGLNNLHALFAMQIQWNKQVRQLLIQLIKNGCTTYRSRLLKDQQKANQFDAIIIYCSIIKRFHHEPLGSRLLSEKLIALSWSAAVIICHHLRTESRGMLLASSRNSLNLENSRAFQRFLKNLLSADNYSICSQTSFNVLKYLV